MGQRSLFDVQNRLQSGSKMGDPLERLAVTMRWESFRPLLVKVHEKERQSNAGRKPIDVVLMFKVLILQTLYNLADEQVEYQIRDWLSFARFLGLGIEDRVPDATTVRGFRERLKELELMEVLFDRFGDYLAAEGYQAKQGSRSAPSGRRETASAPRSAPASSTSSVSSKTAWAASSSEPSGWPVPR